MNVIGMFLKDVWRLILFLIYVVEGFMVGLFSFVSIIWSFKYVMALINNEYLKKRGFYAQGTASGWLMAIVAYFAIALALLMDIFIMDSDLVTSSDPILFTLPMWIVYTSLISNALGYFVHLVYRVKEGA
tara:strand:+ start:283 stop:672 length:390 start_codon:yes stop_codon:yes gene_type:complete